VKSSSRAASIHNNSTKNRGITRLRAETNKENKAKDKAKDKAKG